MRIPRFLMRVVAACALIAPVLSGPVHAQEPSDLQKILDGKVVRLGAVQAPPWYQKDLLTNAWGGLVPDVMNEIFSKDGVKIEYVETQWGTAVAGLQSGRFDLLGAYNSTPERALSIDFTKPMGSLKFAVLTLKGGADAYATWDQVNQPTVKLAAVDGAGATRALMPAMTKTQWVALPNSDGMYLELESGRVDALVTSDVQISQYLKLRRRGAMTVPTPVREEPTNIGLRKSPDPKLREWLDARLDALKADGTLDRIWAKYVRSN
jgi:polar amino acid transport system substrate-binding protein